MLNGERSQTHYLLVVCAGSRQVADEEMHGTYMRRVRKAGRRRLDSVG